MTAGLFLWIVGAIGLALCVVMSGAWLIWRRLGNSGWVDAVWTFGLATVGIAGALFALNSDGAVAWRLLGVAALVAVWALRLGVHIARRTHGKVDDPRYAKLQRDWGDHARWQMFVLLQKQALVSIPLALAIVLAAWNPAPTFRAQDLLGALILLIGIGGEAIADNQLRRFGTDPANRGAVCDIGLWRWSRHPNYFFEWVSWLAYPVIAIDLSGSYPWGWLALAAPLCMYWLLRHVSGVPPLEEHMVATRGHAYRAYQARTSAFFPLPTKTGAHP